VTTNAARAATVARALRAGIERDHETLRTLVTDDVRAWTPAFATTARDELVAALDDRDDAFSDVDIHTTPSTSAATSPASNGRRHDPHGPLTLDPDTTIEPTGTRVSVHGITVAEFDGEHICSFPSVLGRARVLERLGLVGS